MAVKRIWWETWVIILIGLTDLIFTIWLIDRGYATESNSVLGFYLENGGLICFSGAKILLLIGPLFSLEVGAKIWSRSSQRRIFLRWVVRTGLILYLLVYIASTWYINANPARL